MPGSANTRPQIAPKGGDSGPRCAAKYCARGATWYGNEMITGAGSRTLAWRSAMRRHPKTLVSLLLGLLLMLIFGVLSAHVTADGVASKLAAAPIATAEHADPVIASTTMQQELAAGAAQTCEEPCAIPTPKPVPTNGEAKLLALCALALLAGMALLVPRVVRSRCKPPRAPKESAAHASGNLDPPPTPSPQQLSISRS